MTIQMSRCWLRPLVSRARQITLSNSPIASIHLTSNLYLPLIPPKAKEDEHKPGVKIKDVVRVKQFFDEQALQSEYDSKQFINTLENFQNIRKIKRFGYAEFVGAALPAMKEFGVHKDLESYKALMRIFPPGAFVPASKLASGFFPHFIQQTAAIEILCQMEENRIMPDREMETHIIAVFSKYSQVWEKCARMIYWLTKFKNANPFPFPETIPQDPLELAIIALKRMSIDPQSDVSVYSTSQIDKDAKDDTWICFAQSESQCRLIEELDPQKYRVSLDGPFQVWVESYSVSYFVLFARDMTSKGNTEDQVEAFLESEHEKNNVSDIPLSNFGCLEKVDAIDPLRKLHIQDDGTILAVVATGSSSQESLITLVRILEKENPRLRSIPVIISNKENVDQNQYANLNNESSKEQPNTDNL